MELRVSKRAKEAGYQLYKFQEETIREKLGLPSRHKYNGSEMGLGKTAQAYVYANTIHAENLLVICPANLRINWGREAWTWLIMNKRQVPKPILAARDVQTIYKKNFAGRKHWYPSPLIVSYDMIVRSELVFNYLMSRPWDLIIADEFQYCKNIEAKRTSAVCNYLWGNTEEMLLMSGTPLTNCATDLFPALHKIIPTLKHVSKEDKKLCSDYTLFAEAFAYRWEHPTYGTNYQGVRNHKKLKALVRDSGFFVRRTLDEALPELPACRYERVDLNISVRRIDKEDEALYETYVDLYEERIHRDGSVSKIEKQLGTFRRELGEAKAKSKETLDFLEYLLDDYGYPVVIFTYHRNVLQLIKQRLKRYRPAILEGQTSSGAKQKAIDDFQSGKTNVFIGQVIAAGVGITLTRAHHAVFLEWDWLPTNNLQAIRRLLRIGQKNHVIAHFLVSKNKYDKKLVAAMVSKMNNIDKVI